MDRRECAQSHDATFGGNNVHTHLKGRIFSKGGISYLVLHEDAGSPDWVHVKPLTPNRQVERVRIDEVLSCVPGLQRRRA